MIAEQWILLIFGKQPCTIFKSFSKFGIVTKPFFIRFDKCTSKFNLHELRYENNSSRDLVFVTFFPFFTSSMILAYRFSAFGDKRSSASSNETVNSRLANLAKNMRIAS